MENKKKNTIIYDKHEVKTIKALDDLLSCRRSTLIHFKAMENIQKWGCKMKEQNNYLIKYRCPKCDNEWVLIHDSVIDSNCQDCGARHISALDSFLVKDIENYLAKIRQGGK